LVAVLALVGLVWGIVADRISARWPDHLPGELDDSPGAGGTDVPSPAESPTRGPDWRTVLVAVIGAGSLAAVGLRFEEPGQLALFGGWAVILVLLLATDLDQRLLPDVLTLPLIPAAAIAGLLGWNPLVTDGMLWPLVAAVAIPGGLYLVSIPYGSGAIGVGDLKLLVSVGLTLGFLRAFYAVFFGAVLSGVAVLVLLAARVIGRRSYIPFGPFLILGSLWAALLI
jgi:leader peptidase (prepilin peptidase)/N-methyltransferase